MMPPAPSVACTTCAPFLAKAMPGAWCPTILAAMPGKKPPTAGQYGAPKSPAQKLKLRKAQQQRSQDWQQDTKGT